MYDPQGNRYSMMDGGWMAGFAVVSVVLLLIAVIAVLANLAFHVSAGRAHPALSTGAAAALPESRLVLDARLARGEVAPEEYQALRSLLDG